jgi:acyl-CoA synthetase (AMP-forming)/AMP-acid ligase II
VTSVIHEARSFTWAETYERCRRFASFLDARGVERCEMVATMLPNIPAMFECHFAVPMTGAVLNPHNIRLDAAALAFMLDHGGAKMLPVDPEFANAIAEALKPMKGPAPLVIDVADAAFGEIRQIDEIEYEEALLQGDPDFAWSLPEDEWDAIALSHTFRHDGQPEGRCHPPSWRLSQCGQQHHRRRHGKPSHLSLDAADVPFNSVVNAPEAEGNATNPPIVGLIAGDVQEVVNVLDPETMQPIPRDGKTIGEVMFRGNIVMKGYLKNEAATRHAFAGGWFHTGDLGVLDADGYVTIKDRSKDIIISGGESISSVEVEDVLYTHPLHAACCSRRQAGRQMG